MNSEKNSLFGLGKGDLIEITYKFELPMRLDRWLVSQRPEQSRTSIQNFINSGLILINYKPAKAKTPLKEGDIAQAVLTKFVHYHPSLMEYSLSPVCN